MARSRPSALVGALGAPGLATVDEHGCIHPEGADHELDWWIGADDRWHIPAEDPMVRQRAVGAAPVIETFVQVPGGEAVHRVWGVPGASALAVVEVENASAAPFALALVLRSTEGGNVREVALDGPMLTVAGRPALALQRPPSRWAVSAGEPGRVRTVVTTGDASEGPLPSTRDRRGVEAALIYPVPHHARFRVTLVLEPRRTRGAVELGRLPGFDAVVRGWSSQLDRGLRTDLPDETLQRAVDAARAALLLLGGGRADADVVAALEDWGFDTEAADAWHRLPLLIRRRAAHREPIADPWSQVAEHLRGASPALAFPGGPVPFLRAVRAMVARDVDSGVELLPALPSEWFGRDLAAHGVPTAAGLVSFAVRWHGERPALLWEAPEGVRLSAPRLDHSWEVAGGSGEALLAAPDPAG